MARSESARRLAALGALALGLGALGCTSDLPFTVQPAPSEGILSGVVSEAGDPGLHPPSTTISVHGETLDVDAAGTFRVRTSLDRTLVTVAAPGYVPWRSTVAIGSAPQPISVGLVPAAAPADVAAPILAGDAELRFPAGSTGMLSATWIGSGGRDDRAPLFAVTHDINYIDGDPWGLVGVLHVDGSIAAGTPFDVQITLPSGVAADAVRLVRRGGDGQRGVQIAPAPQSASAVTFSVGAGAESVFDLDLVERRVPSAAAPAVATVIATDGQGILLVADGAGAAPKPGAAVAGSALQLTVPSRASATLQDPRGTELCVRGGHSGPASVLLEPDGQHGLRVTFVDAGGGVAEAQGSVGVLVKATSTSSTDGPFIATAAGVRLADSGTAFTFAGGVCPDGNRVTLVEVQHGEVRVIGDGESTVSRGSMAESCPGCPTINPGDCGSDCVQGQLFCCNPDTCPGGCCAPTGECLKGNDLDACGKDGFSCSVCGAGEVCQGGDCSPCGGSQQPCCVGGAIPCKTILDPNMGAHEQTCGPAGKCCIPDGSMPVNGPADCCGGKVGPQGVCGL